MYDFSKYDRHYKRWMPHINLLYPFLADNDDGATFEDAAKKLRQSLASFKPFTVAFTKDSFSFFKHKKDCTLWLKPLWTSGETVLQVNADSSKSESVTNQNHPEIMDLQRQLVDLFPECSDLNQISSAGFTPHLSLGQFSAKDINTQINILRNDWTDMKFSVSEIQLISRANFEDPFHVRHHIHFEN